MASLFIGFLVEKYVTCQSRKSDFGWHCFRFSPCLMRKRVEKSEAIMLALLDTFQELKLLYLMFFLCISDLMKSTVVYVAIQFSPEIERKVSKEYLDIILAVKESFERFSYLGFIFEKKNQTNKHWEASLKHKHKV